MDYVQFYLFLHESNSFLDVELIVLIINATLCCFIVNKNILLADVLLFQYLANLRGYMSKVSPNTKESNI